MSDSFDAALTRLYEVFAAPTPRVIEGCPCCIGTRKTDILLSKPLRALSDDDLARYGAGVFLTVGGQRDFAYLLPRILEVSAKTPGWYPSAEVVLGKLRLANWETWGRSEHEAVLAFLSAWFDQTAQRLGEDARAAMGVGELLCGLARARLDLSAYLDRLSKPECAAGLAELVRWADREPLDRDRPQGFWEDAPDGWRQLADFLASKV